MGLFTPKPYSMDSLNIAERAAVRTALKVGLMVGSDSSVKKKLQTALNDFDKGKLSKEDMAAVIACLIASLAAIKSGDDPERSSQLQQQQVVEVSMAMALDKLKNML
ncbi:MAG: hypothetical protein K6E17_00930 [Clostridiales bacterium]|nr:hypothetical protein [Clostridiales bacterium]